MGFFDLFKKKGTTEEQPQSEEQVQQSREELNAGLEKTKSGFFSKLARAVAGRTTVDADVLDDLAYALARSGQREEALSAYRRLAEIYGEDPRQRGQQLHAC